MSIKKYLKNIDDIALGVLVFFALFLLIGIFDYSSFWGHTDEIRAIATSLKVGSNPNPGFFDWGTLYFYMMFPIYGTMFVFGYVFGICGSLNQFIAHFVYHPSEFIIVGRIISAALSLASVWLLIKLTYKKEFGVLCILFVAALFFSGVAYLALPDALMTFLSILAIWFYFKMLEGKADWFVVGALFGLAVAAKYNAALILLIAMMTLIISFRVKEFFLIGITSLAAFFVVTPFAILDYRTFLSDLSTLISNGQFYARHMIPILLALMFLIIFINRSFKSKKHKKSVWLVTFNIFGLGIWMTLALLTCVMSPLPSHPDAQMRDWIESNIPENATIYVDEFGPILQNTKANLLNQTYLSESRDPQSFGRYREAIREFEPMRPQYDVRQIWTQRVATGEAHAGGPDCYNPELNITKTSFHFERLAYNFVLNKSQIYEIYSWKPVYLVIDSKTETQLTCPEQKAFYESVKKSELIREFGSNDYVVRLYELSN